MTENLTKRVENAANDITPQTRPDERRSFLGSLRERVFVRMTIKDCEDAKLTKLFMDHFADYKGYTILINANTPNPTFVGQIESRASKEQVPFCLVNDESARKGDDDSAILVVSKEAINRMRIELTQVYAPPLPAEKLPAPKKKGFLARFFGGNK